MSSSNRKTCCSFCTIFVYYVGNFAISKIKLPWGSIFFKEVILLIVNFENLQQFRSRLTEPVLWQNNFKCKQSKG